MLHDPLLEARSEEELRTFEPHKFDRIATSPRKAFQVLAKVEPDQRAARTPGR